MNHLTFIHLTDTHIGPTPDYSRHGFASEPALIRLLDHIRSLPVEPDFIVHTGDIVTNPDPRSYERAARILADLQVPIYYVNGNHDTAAHIHEYLPTGPRTDWQPGTERLAYEFEVRGEVFVVLDGRGPDSIDPHGDLPREQLDRNMLLLNGDDLHAALRPARDRIRGVFYGHVHQSMQTIRDGIVYTAAPSTFAQFKALPEHELPLEDADYPPGFNLVQCLPGQTIVQQHVLPRT